METTCKFQIVHKNMSGPQFEFLSKPFPYNKGDIRLLSKSEAK